MASNDNIAGGYDAKAAYNRGEGVTGTEPALQSAVSWPADPYARSYANPYNLYPGWSQEDNPDPRVQGAALNHYPRQYSWHEAPNNSQNVNLAFERVVIADEGIPSTTGTVIQRGALPYEPNNNPPDSDRAQHNPPVYTFVRQWIDSQRDQNGLLGDHISMSDNIIVQPVGGMRPNLERNRRNTYRIEPEPWDVNYTDVGTRPDSNQVPPGIPTVPPNVTGNAYRLG